MSKIDGKTPFNELIKHCVDDQSPLYHAAWKEFQNRYHDTIVRAVYNRCASWKSTRLDRQRADVIADVVLEVYEILRTKLITYRVEDGDGAFPWWLGTISARATGNFLKRRLSQYEEPKSDGYHLDNSATRETSDSSSALEIFEFVVEELHRARKNRTQRIESQIHLFLLMTVYDLPEDAIIKFHPLLRNEDDNSLKNIKFRGREVLRENRDKIK